MLEDSKGSPLRNLHSKETQPWNENLENKLKKYITLCKEKSNEHDNMARKFYYMNNLFGLSSILINLGTGTSLTIIGSVQYQCNNLEVILISSIGNFLAMTLISISQFFDFSFKCFEHNKYSDLYNELHMDMDAVLDKDPEFRPDANEILTFYRLKLEKLLDDEPIIYKNICY